MALRETYASQLNDPLTAAVTSDTFTGPQDLVAGTHTAPGPALNIPAYYLKVGSTIRTEAGGSFSTTGTPTLVFGTYFGATALAVNVALTTASGAVTLPWRMRTVTHVRAIAAVTGYTLTTITQGELWYGTTLTAVTQIPIPGVALATTNIDNSAAAKWSVQATYSASSVSNIVVLHSWIVEEVTHI
jgi:hypothetical protein